MKTILAGILLVPSLAFAQIQPNDPGYKLFTGGCTGSGGPGCYGANLQEGTLQGVLQQIGMQYAIQFDTIGTTLLLGLDYWCKASGANLQVPVAVYLANAAGAPQAQPAVTSTLTVGTKLGWYGVNFAKPITLAKGQRAFVFFSLPTGTVRLSPPAVTQGFPQMHFQRSPTSTGWGTAKRTVNWTWRLRCAGARVPAAPVLWANIKGPTLGKPFTLELAVAPANVPALIITGASNKKWGPFPLPLDLTPLGAPSCTLLVSFNLSVAIMLDASGKGSLGFTIPNHSSLLNTRFYNQAIVFDSKVNSLGLTFSNGGNAKISR